MLFLSLLNVDCIFRAARAWSSYSHVKIVPQLWASLSELAENSHSQEVGGRARVWAAGSVQLLWWPVSPFTCALGNYMERDYMSSLMFLWLLVVCGFLCRPPPPPCWKAEGWFGNLIQVWRWTKPGAPKFCCRLSDMSVSVYICVYTTPPWATLELDTHSVAQGVGFSVAGVSPLLSRVTMDSLVLIGRLPHRDFSPNSRSSVRAGAGLICPWLVSNWS